MSEGQTWTTELSWAEPNRVLVRGYHLDELMGRVSFAEAIYLLFRGELPPPGIRPLLEALLVASLDHGPGAPSALAARTAASTGAALNAAIAAGVLCVNRHHGGAIEDCMLLLERTVAQKREQGKTAGEVARETVKAALAAGRRLPGFGHRVHTHDPRTARLYRLAEEAGVGGEYVEMMRALQEALREAGKDLPINVDGAIASLLCALGLPAALGNVFFIIGRVPGLAAQAYEEATTQKPMRRLDPAACRYAGPPERPLARS